MLSLYREPVAFAAGERGGTVSKVHNPRLKKLLSLERDHRVLPLSSEDGLRKKKIATKAGANHQLRRAEHVALQHATEDPEASDLAVQEARKARKRVPKKAAVVSLKQRLEMQADDKVQRTASVGRRAR
jgi:hypothetical protein